MRRTTFFIAKYKELPEAYTEILSDLRAQYILGYSPHPGKQGLRRVEVRMLDRKHKVRCRTNYFHQGS